MIAAGPDDLSGHSGRAPGHAAGRLGQAGGQELGSGGDPELESPDTELLGQGGHDLGPGIGTAVRDEIDLADGAGMVRGED
ncbi:MAG: hypothetical protein H6R32_306, partial [Candidatus Aminicenantes bacterium]|nr:hypothetical protein [Candidatus Aminicenantes bacterium]